MKTCSKQKIALIFVSAEFEIFFPSLDAKHPILNLPIFIENQNKQNIANKTISKKPFFQGFENK